MPEFYSYADSLDVCPCSSRALQAEGAELSKRNDYDEIEPKKRGLEFPSSHFMLFPRKTRVSYLSRELGVNVSAWIVLIN